MKKDFKVRIEGFAYTICIEEENEEVMRRAIKKLKDRLAELQQKYESSSFDRLAMAAMMLSIEAEENQLIDRYSTTSVEIDELEAKIRNALGE